MDARDRFHDMLLRRIGPALRTDGFAGTAPTWRRRNPEGDWGVVNVQKSAFGTADDVHFYINLSFVLEPNRVDAARRREVALSKIPSAYDGVWNRRIDPPRAPGRTRFDRWEFGGGALADTVADELIATLRSTAEPILDRLLDRAELARLLAENEDGAFLGGHVGGGHSSATLGALLAESSEGATAQGRRNYALAMPAKRVLAPAQPTDGTKLQGPPNYFPSIEKTYGRPIQEWLDLANERLDTEKHMEVVAWLKAEHGLGHGHANAIVGYVKNER